MLPLGLPGCGGAAFPSVLAFSAATLHSAIFFSNSTIAAGSASSIFSQRSFNGLSFSLAASLSRFTHASAALPPQALLISPTGTPSVWWSWRPKK